mmetsp:Transcript_6598/g.16816  ORF Transcript_6598/g.16816 Transcript_6598/m.16816 type:complete len:134 (+) Transcript_6598:410-811(+)
MEKVAKKIVTNKILLGSRSPSSAIHKQLSACMRSLNLQLDVHFAHEIHHIYLCTHMQSPDLRNDVLSSYCVISLTHLMQKEAYCRTSKALYSTMADALSADNALSICLTIEALGHKSPRTPPPAARPLSYRLP